MAGAEHGLPRVRRRVRRLVGGARALPVSPGRFAGGGLRRRSAIGPRASARVPPGSGAACPSPAAADPGPPVGPRRRRIGEFVAGLGPDAGIVNIGAGRTDYGPNVLNLDVFPAPSVHALATSELLPLRSDCFDGVILEAVLEHVRDADATLEEIRRVLVPGGVALIDVPFLQPYHPSPGDYRRYTEQGLRTRLEQLGFSVVESGVSVGPASAFAWIGSHFFAMLVSGRSNRIYRGARIITDLLLVPVQVRGRMVGPAPRRHADRERCVGDRAGPGGLSSGPGARTALDQERPVTSFACASKARMIPAPPARLRLRRDRSP